MSSALTHRNLPHLLLSARETLMVHFRPILVREGISEQQWRVLRTLFNGPGMDATSLAKKCQLLSSSLTRMLRALEQTGLITRTHVAQDLRRQSISLTSQGHSLVVRIAPDIEAVYQRLQAHIGSDVIESLYAQIDTMQDSMRTFGMVGQQEHMS